MKKGDKSNFVFFFLWYVFSLSPEADTNPWLQQSLTAAKKKKCSEFYCIKKTEVKDEEGLEADDDAGGTKSDDHLEAEGPPPTA